MKRYDLTLTPMGHTLIGEVWCGRFVLADDPAIQAAIEAMEDAPIVRLGESLEKFKERYTLWYREQRRNALAGLKGEA